MKLSRRGLFKALGIGGAAGAVAILSKHVPAEARSVDPPRTDEEFGGQDGLCFSVSDSSKLSFMELPVRKGWKKVEF